MTVCGIIEMPVMIFLIAVSFIAAALIYFFKLKKRFNENLKQKVIALGIAVLIFIVLFIIEMVLFSILGLDCTGPELKY